MIRTPAVAGQFYPARATELRALVDRLLAAAPRRALPGLRALVAPHAGYAYSGPVAASAFVLMPAAARVLLLGPSHHVPLDGMALSGASAWATPLGEVPVATDLRRRALQAGAVIDDRPHEWEHALEVELPFLQRVCRDGLEILPVAVGWTRPAEVADLIEAVGCLAVVSTDLSHYHDDATARRLDAETAAAVVRREPEAIGPDRACGLYALRGLVEHARRADLRVELLDLRTSADASGDTSSVVGYGAFAVASS